MRLPWIALALLTAGSVSDRVAAQLVAGERIRVHPTNGATVTGTLVDVVPAGLVVDTRVREYLIPSEGISRVERSLGARSEFGRAFGTTVGAGALILGVVAATSFENCPGGIIPCSKFGAFAYGAILGGAVMVPLGVIFGLVAKFEVWEPVSLASPAPFGAARFSVAPLVHGVALRVSIPLGASAR